MKPRVGTGPLHVHSALVPQSQRLGAHLLGDFVTCAVVSPVSLTGVPRAPQGQLHIAGPFLVLTLA